jgi:FMN reductase
MSNKKTHVLILSTSLNPDSKSLILAQRAHAQLRERNIDSTLVSLRDFPLPFCDGSKEISHDPNALKLRELVQNATHVIFAMPIYTFDVNAAAKNLVELLFNWGCWYEDEWDEHVMGKTAAFLLTGGADHSRHAVLSFANTLMVECWWWIVPRWVYAMPAFFENGQLKDKRTLERIDRLIDDLLHGPAGVAKAG